MVLSSVFLPVVFDRSLVGSSSWNAGLYFFLFQGTVIITDLSHSHEKAQWSSVLIGDRMQPRVHAAFCLSD